MAVNPVSFTESIVDDFLRYQLTTYGLADADLYGQMRALLQLEESRATPLRQGPYISLSKPFAKGATIQALVDEKVFHPGMLAVVPYEGLRAHQDRAVRAIARGRNTLVATGTGSGKTESFLYPIISRCLELEEQGAPPGIVAVLIYPMNALAEDQLDRLRGLLAGRGISFGMYVGKTPTREEQVHGERMPPSSSNEDYQTRRRQLQEAGDPRPLIPREERASREAMRKEGGAPRILLTNTKQLELLLTRGRDIGLFDNAPLEYLVFDEAHTFRGAQGAETACLIRRLRSFCGKEPHETVCVATSATMADPERGEDAGLDFARRFFGVEVGQVELVGEIYAEQQWNAHRWTPEEGPENPNATLKRVLEAVDLPEDQVGEAISACHQELGGASLPTRGWQKRLYADLASNELVYQLHMALQEPRALSNVPGLVSAKVGRQVTEAEVLAWLALAAAYGRSQEEGPLLRPVLHTFIRGVGGAVVTFSEPAASARLWLSGEDADDDLGDGYRRFPLLTCTTCGQHYYEGFVKDFEVTTRSPQGGDKVGDRRVWPHHAEELGGDRVVLVDRLVVTTDEDEGLDDEEEEAPDAGEPVGDGHLQHRRLWPGWICVACGALHEEHGSSCVDCQRQESLRPIHVVRSHPDKPGVVHSCVSCQAPGRRVRGSYREPARPVRATAVADVHVLAQSMIHFSERPRLLVFADNRQDAAFQAGWMQDHARRYRLRALLAQQIPEEGASVGDVVASLDDVMEKDKALSRALLPEVWKVQHLDAAGTKHRKEREYFLRIQVLREVATGVKQRIGLEPWGRLKVDYVGLSPDLPFVQRWAPRLSTTPEDLAEGIAALLDHHRRRRALHDRSRLFEKYWDDNDREIQFGYFPPFSGGPQGVKLSRRAEDSPARALQWVGSRPTQVWNAVKSWGVPEDEVGDFLRGLWTTLVERKLLVGVQLIGWGGPLRGSTGVYQLDSGALRLLRHHGRWRCQQCRRTTVRAGPTRVCMAWRCGGGLVWETESADDFDLHVLDHDYAMLRAAEHSAQVPVRTREILENQFKGDLEQVNTLVCTPTLELGVDIGALDAVLMRNVPPTAANYWQRAGRAGRRHRMAVDLTYAQPRGFDQAYFRDPLMLLGGVVEPPRFNLRNDQMVRKHVHATVLTALYGIARRASPEERQRIELALQRCLPPTLRGYLFTPGGDVMLQPTSVDPLATAINEHRSVVLQEVRRAFATAWPVEDRDAVDDDRLAAIVDGMASALAGVLKRFKRRLDWALDQLARLRTIEERKGALDPEDEAHRRRCLRMIRRFKGTTSRKRSDAQGGISDSETMGALAREGFLPGYGLESGSIVGTAEPPRMTEGLDDFELPRPPTLALREYVPGNAIYANGFRFVPRHFQLTADDTLRFSVDAENQAVHEVGKDQPTVALGQQEIRAVPICDVLMPSTTQISDEDEFRWQMPVAVYGNDRGFHRGGGAYSAETLDLRFRRGVQLRLVNVGSRSEVEQQKLGYPVCLACGYSLSPYTNAQREQAFVERHLERCGHDVQRTGFYADVEVDVLGFHDLESRTVAFSVAEAVRIGAARVLDMETEDLQLLSLGKPGDARVDMLLYDPMPGGSGLLDQVIQRWPEVVSKALEVLRECPGACERSCVECLQTYRNRFYHEHLDRHRAYEVLSRVVSPLEHLHPIPEKLPTTQTTTGQPPQTYIEAKFLRLVQAAGLPDPLTQFRIDLPGHHHTIPDFYYGPENQEEDVICIFLDGMAGHIHGNPDQREKDVFLREQLRARGYRVLEVTSDDLDDKPAMVQVISRLARWLDGKGKQKALKADPSWYDAAHEHVQDLLPAQEAPTAPQPKHPHLRLVEPEEVEASLPVYDLRVAAGAFSDGQLPRVLGHTPVPARLLGPGRFVAQVVGDSMDRVAPLGSWCVWQHLGDSRAAAPAVGDDLIVRAPDGADPELGRFTFKRLQQVGKGRVLAPLSSNPSHAPIPLDEDGEVVAIARLVAVLPAQDEEVAAAWNALLDQTVDEVHQILAAVRGAGAALPSAGMEWRAPSGRVEGSQLELAWADRKVAVVLPEDLSDKARAALEADGWTLFEAPLDPRRILEALEAR